VKIDTLLKKAPCIRLCRGVYAFCQFHKRFDKDLELIDSGKFWRFILEIDENAILISRLNIINSEAVELLLSETKHQVEKEVKNIKEAYKGLIQKMARREIDEHSALTILQKLRRRHIITKKTANFYDKWLKMDHSKYFINLYPTIRKANYTHEKMGTYNHIYA
jgi:hypothetical protein